MNKNTSINWIIQNKITFTVNLMQPLMILVRKMVEENSKILDNWQYLKQKLSFDFGLSI